MKLICWVKGHKWATWMRWNDFFLRSCRRCGKVMSTGELPSWVDRVKVVIPMTFDATGPLAQEIIGVHCAVTKPGGVKVDPVDGHVVVSEIAVRV